jgi:uncharacterized protein YqgC (DUF456 family)
MDGVTVFAGLIMLVGIVVPVLPGLLLVWVAVLIWAWDAQTTAGWVVLGITTALALSGFVLRYLLPGRRMAASGVTRSTIAAGVVLGVAGFFLIPVVGAFLGFPLGIYLAERAKRGTHAAAWPSTKQALKAIGLSMGIELLTGLAMATTWLIGVAATA